MLGRRHFDSPTSGEINHLSPRGSQQPALGVGRTAITRPVGQGGKKSLGKGVFGGSEVARTRRQKGDELAVAAARDRVGQATHPLVALATVHLLTFLRCCSFTPSARNTSRHCRCRTLACL